MASRAQRVAALEQFTSTPELRALTSARRAGGTSRAERFAALSAWENVPDYQALTAQGDQIGIGVDLESVRDALAKLEDLHPGIMADLDEIVKAEAFDLEDAIAADWPVDTGFSQSQWDTMALDQAVYVVVNYALYSALINGGAAAKDALGKADGAAQIIAMRVRGAIARRLNTPGGA